MEFPILRNEAAATDDQVDLYRSKPGFAQYFTDHMARAVWTEGAGWRENAVVPYAPMAMDPACTVFHYAQEIFEGLKAYRHDDNTVVLFRPDMNAERFARSARRMAMPVIEPADFVTSVVNFVTADARWVPDGPEKTMYVRPFMFGSENFLGVRSSREFTYLVIGAPAGPYMKDGVTPVDIWLTRTFVRSVQGGTGTAKCGGNYAAGLMADQEARAHGCSQVLFTDAVEHRYVEELNAMNVFFVTSDNELVTPELTGTILEGVTRDSLLTLGCDMGLTVAERRIELTEVLEGIADGTIAEMFACGTGAGVTPIGLLRTEDAEHRISETAGEITMALRQRLFDIQLGRAEDTHDWLVTIHH